MRGQTTRRPWTGAFIAAAAIATACSGGGGSVAGSGTGASASDLESFLGQYCDLYGPCCAQSSKTYDQAKCRALFVALTGGQASYNAAAGQQCLDAARVDAALPTFCKDGITSATNAKCKNVFATPTSAGGGKAAGQACDTSSDCANPPDGDVTCLTTSSNGANIRLCQQRLHVKEGADCAGTKETTESGFSISFSGGSGTGGPPPTINVCWVDDNVYCDSKTKKCVRIQDVGGSCESLDTHACNKAGYCDTATKRCVAKKAIGEACTSTSQCTEKSYCRSSSKKCEASTPDGGPCTLSEECEEKSCTNGTCGSALSISLSTALFCQ